MKTLKASLALMIFSLLIFSCSSARQVKRIPQFKFAGTTLSKGIEKKGNTAIPVEPTNTFSTEDTEVIAHVKMENLSGNHKLRWDWYDSEDNLYASSGNLPIKTSDLQEASAWHRLSIKGDKAEDYPGQWEVRVFFDDTLMGSTNFILKAIEDIAKLPEGISQKPYPKDWGLIIGIEDYAHLPSVDYARKDALIIKDYFVKVLGVPEENIIFLIDNDATKARIEGYLRQYIPDNISKQTTLYVYFAGHGAPDMEEGDPYLVPHDGDSRFITQTGYHLKTFYQDLDNLDVKRVYVFLDSCFSGVASRASEMLTKGARPALIHVNEIQLSSDEVVSLSASQSGQISNAYPETKHGLFTYFLLRALSGEADKDDDRWISVQEIYEFVKNHVNRVSRRMGTEQTPVISPPLDMIKDIAISRVLGQ